MNAALERTILERLQRLDETRLAEVLDFVDFLAERHAAPREASEAQGETEAEDVFLGFEPFASRGGNVTDELVNRLREEQQV